MSLFELAKGFTNPDSDANVQPIPDDLVEAQKQIQARRKLALIMKYKSRE